MSCALSCVLSFVPLTLFGKHETLAGWRPWVVGCSQSSEYVLLESRYSRFESGLISAERPKGSESISEPSAS